MCLNPKSSGQFFVDGCSSQPAAALPPPRSPALWFGRRASSLPLGTQPTLTRCEPTCQCCLSHCSVGPVNREVAGICDASTAWLAPTYAVPHAPCSPRSSFSFFLFTAVSTLRLPTLSQDAGPVSCACLYCYSALQHVTVTDYVYVHTPIRFSSVHLWSDAG